MAEDVIVVKSKLDPVYKISAIKRSDPLVNKAGIFIYTLSENDENEDDVIYNEKLDKYIVLEKYSYTLYVEQRVWYLAGKVGSNIVSTEDTRFCVTTMSYKKRPSIKIKEYFEKLEKLSTNYFNKI